MTTITMSNDELLQWIGRAVDLGKYDVARGLLEDMIKGKIQHENSKVEVPGLRNSDEGSEVH